MNKEVYRNLRGHLHKHPLGFPETESEVELKILQRLFSEEEAVLVCIFLLTQVVGFDNFEAV